MKRLTLDEQIETLIGHNVKNQKIKVQAQLAMGSTEAVDEMISVNAQLIASLEELKALKQQLTIQ